VDHKRDHAEAQGNGLPLFTELPRRGFSET
jgi:hypothetical protein